MQLAPISPLVPPHATTAPAAPLDAPATIGMGASNSPAAPTVGAPAEAAIDGVARLLAAPIVDFPGIAAGDTFDIVKGSKVGFLGVKGHAEVLALDDDNASFKIRAGAFGIKVDVVVDVTRTGEDTVRISSRGTGIPDTDADGRIIESRTNYAEFERIDNPDERTVISHDGAGRIEIDTVVPTFGDAHLVLEKRD